MGKNAFISRLGGARKRVDLLQSTRFKDPWLMGSKETQGDCWSDQFVGARIKDVNDYMSNYFFCQDYIFNVKNLLASWLGSALGLYPIVAYTPLPAGYMIKQIQAKDRVT